SWSTSPRKSYAPASSTNYPNPPARAPNGTTSRTTSPSLLADTLTTPDASSPYSTPAQPSSTTRQSGAASAPPCSGQSTWTTLSNANAHSSGKSSPTTQKPTGFIKVSWTP